MKELIVRILCIIGGIMMGAVGHFLYLKLRYPYGKIKVEKFKLLEDEM